MRARTGPVAPWVRHALPWVQSEVVLMGRAHARSSNARSRLLRAALHCGSMQASTWHTQAEQDPTVSLGVLAAPDAAVRRGLRTQHAAALAVPGGEDGDGLCVRADAPGHALHFL